MSVRKRRLTAYDRRLLESQPASEEQRTDYPVGWYFARFGEDLKAGQVVPVEFMSHQFALFRTKSGRVGMVDSQCCHMGADLGRCGWATDDRLVCGFHAWEFDTDGRCTEVPGVPSTKIPRRARQRAVPVIERAGNIYFWYGPEPAWEFPDLSYFDSSRYLNVKGELYIGRGDPLPISEHMVDSYHFPYSHRIVAPIEYEVLLNEGHRFEFRLRPIAGRQSSNLQRLFKPHAFGEMAAPCVGVYRTQRSETIDRMSPPLTILTGGTPVREGLLIFTWRIAIRKIGPDPFFAPLNWALGRLMWFVIRWNYNSDMEVLKWMRTLPKPLSVKPDGPAIREFRAFYRRHILPGWRFGDAVPEPETSPDGARPALTDNVGGR